VTPEPVRCDGAKWIADLSYDDKNRRASLLNPGQPFPPKGWRMLNTTCPGRPRWIAIAARKIGSQPIPEPRSKAGETFRLPGNPCPDRSGTYQRLRIMRDARTGISAKDCVS